MESNNDTNTLTAFMVLTVVLTLVVGVGADVSGVAGWLVAGVVGMIGATIAIGAWAIGRNLSK